MSAIIVNRVFGIRRQISIQTLYNELKDIKNLSLCIYNDEGIINSRKFNSVYCIYKQVKSSKFEVHLRNLEGFVGEIYSTDIIYKNTLMKEYIIISESSVPLYKIEVNK